MRELLVEVFAAMRGNRMRIALTGFSIGWGIFILYTKGTVPFVYFCTHCG
jgi:hypothetical protein